MTAAERRQRDQRALRRLLQGESWESVASRYRLSRVQLWRRVGKALKRAKARDVVAGGMTAATA